VLAIYNAIALPLQIPFVTVQNLYSESLGLETFEIIVDICFAIDIFLAFFQAYIDVYAGETIRRPKLIAKHYFKQGFLLDFLSTMPLVLRRLVSDDKVIEQMVTLFRLLKLTRVRRISKLIQNLNWPVETKS